MFGRSGIEKDSLNRKPEGVKISVSLKKAKQIEDEENVETPGKYKLTPRTSLKFTSNFINSTMKTLNEDTAKVFDIVRQGHKINSVSKPPIKDLRHRDRAFVKSLQTIPEQSRLYKKKAEIMQKLTRTKTKIEKLDKNNSRQGDLERMFRLGIALDWNIANKKESNSELTNIPGKIDNDATMNFCEELNCIKSSLENKLLQCDKERDYKIQKTTLELGWINYGNKRNEYQLPHKYVCPYDTSLENKQGKIDGLVTLNELADYAYRDYNTNKDEVQEDHSDYSFDNGPNPGYQSQDTRYQLQDTRYQLQDTRYQLQDARYQLQDTRYQLQDKNCVAIQCDQNHLRDLPNSGESSSNSTEKFSPEHAEHPIYNKSIQNSREYYEKEVWKEKTNRWINNNNYGNACYESLIELTEQEKLTKAWKESLLRWQAEKKDLLDEAAKNHYDIGRRIMTFQTNPQNNTITPTECNTKTNDEIIKDDISTSFVSRNGRQSSKSFVMNKNDVKKFCSHWDSSSVEFNRNTLMTKFLELYSGKNLLDIDAVLSNGGNLLFMRFCFGFKGALVKNQRVWKYFECLLVFLESVNKQFYMNQMMDINLLEDILQLLKIDEIHLFDKLQSLYLLNSLIEDTIGQEIIKTISCSEKYMDLLLQFFIMCEDPQTLITCRTVLLNIIDGSDVSTSRYFLSNISQISLRECAPCNLEMIFQILRFITLCHPSIIDICGQIVLENLNTQDFNLMLEMGQLITTIMKNCKTTRDPSFLVLKGVFDKAVNPLLSFPFDEFQERNTSDHTEIKLDNSNETSLKSEKDLKTLGDNLQETAEQFAALFIINYIFENRSPTSVSLLLDLGALGLSLMATGHKYAKSIQNEGIRLIKTLNQVNFECAASYTLLLSENILTSILEKGVDCFQYSSLETFLCLRQLGYGMLKYWDLWIVQIIAPTKRDLKDDYEMAMSRKEDYTVNLNHCVSNGKNCREVISKALQVPIGQYVAEILHKLKTLWKRDLESKNRDYAFSGSGDDTNTNTDPLDWISNSTESEPECLSLIAPPLQLEEIEQCDVPYFVKDTETNVILYNSQSHVPRQDEVAP